MTALLDIQAIRSGNALADVVAGAGVKLIRSGNELKACCPFHSEKTPISATRASIRFLPPWA